MEIKDFLDLRINELFCLCKEKEKMMIKVELLQSDYEICLSEKYNFEEVVKEFKDSLNDKFLLFSIKEKENNEFNFRVVVMEYEIIQFREKICKFEEEE